MSYAACAAVGAELVSAEGDVPVESDLGAITLCAFGDVGAWGGGVVGASGAQVDVEPVVGDACGVAGYAWEGVACEGLGVVVDAGGEEGEEGEDVEEVVHWAWWLRAERMSWSMRISSWTWGRAPGVAGTLNIVMPEPRVLGV